MKQKEVYPKVATDLFWVQIMWAFGFLGVMLAVHVVKIVLAVIRDDQVNDFFTSVSIAGNIFMLVIGIISVSGFLVHYVGNGVTRRDYFKGATLATIGLSIAIPLMTSVITLIERLIIKLTNLLVIEGSPFPGISIDEDGHLIGDIVQSVILSPFVDFQSNWLLAVLLFCFNLFRYFVVGWLIGATFYRFGTIIGLGAIALSLILIFTSNSLLSAAISLPSHEFFTTIQLSLPLSVLAVLIILGILLTFIRLMTKRVPIKM